MIKQDVHPPQYIYNKALNFFFLKNSFLGFLFVTQV